MRTWTRSTTFWLVTTTLCSASSPTYSETLPPELAGKVEVLKKGQRAASSGFLLDRATLTSLLKRLERRARAAEAAATRARKDATARVDAAERAAKVEVEAERAKYGACRGDLLRRERLYERALKRCVKPTSSWKYWLTTGVGAVVAGGICVGTVAASK
jgi:hypothetical protein